eukprot:TRINITY_DN27759_c0_g1_i1.p1 TRINITY_DN27759_c0_g1~~TRINITY_DN27759_c0_g1_i1.p1  ORF type:complete len:299 (+),score=71.11 TRINITY_DN27759_c0_g1_i1:54-950(+)
MAMSAMGPCCAVASAAPKWLQEAALRMNAHYAGQQWKALEGMYHEGAVIIPLCGERFVRGSEAGGLWSHEEGVIKEVKFTPKTTYQQSPLVLHEVGALTLTLQPQVEGGACDVRHTNYYTRWVQQAPAEWVIAFQCLSCGSHDDKVECRLIGVCSLMAGGSEAAIGTHGTDPPEWLVKKARTFAGMYNAEAVLSLVTQYYHPNAILIPPEVDIVKYTELRGYYKDSVRRHANQGVVFHPMRCLAEGTNVYHELGCATDASGSSWQYYVRWVKEDEVHDWQANIDICVVADVHRHEMAA